MFILYGGAAGGGKSWLGCEWLIVNCYRFPKSRWFMGRKSLTRLMKSTYITFLKVCKELGIPDSDWYLNGQHNFIQFKNGSRIDLLDLAYSPSDPLYERFGSLEYTGGWIEEAGEIDFLCFDVLKTRVGRHMNRELGLLPAKLLLTCNPTQNWLYRVFYKPWRSEKSPPDYAFIQAFYTDNPTTAEDYGRQLNSISDPVLRARLRDGLWEYSTDETSLIAFDAILDLFTNVAEPSDTRFLSGDMARYGGDKIVLGAWEGMNLYKLSAKEKQGIDITTIDVRDMLFREQIPYSRCILDDDGVGGGVVDNLKGVKGFINNSSPLPNPKTKARENYSNLKSQCSYILADKINNHEIAITAELTEQQKDAIIEELQQIKRKDVAADAPLQVVSKKEVKESLGRSPDFADMMVMRMYFELSQAKVFRAPTGGFGGVKGYIDGVG